MMLRLCGWMLLVALALGACGKNDGLRAAPYPPPGGPYPQAPAPYGYSPAPAPQYGNPYGQFNPYQQMPQGYGQGYYPFMPIHNYMQGNPYLQNYWGSYWSGWQQYAGYHGYDQYNFPKFWYEYCPQQWGGNSEWSNFYNYYDQNFYFWMTPQTQFGNANSSHFWANYNGYSYQPLNNYGYCYDWCY